MLNFFKLVNYPMPKPFFRRVTKSFLIICNMVAAVCLVAGSYVKFFDPSSWWFFGLLTLSLPYILFTLLIFFFCWLFAKKIWMMISLLAIAFCWEAGTEYFSLTPGVGTLQWKKKSNSMTGDELEC